MVLLSSIYFYSEDNYIGQRLQLDLKCMHVNNVIRKRNGLLEGAFLFFFFFLENWRGRAPTTNIFNNLDPTSNVS